jgi:hypothetical protein
MRSLRTLLLIDLALLASYADVGTVVAFQLLAPSSSSSSTATSSRRRDYIHHRDHRHEFNNDPISPSQRKIKRMGRGMIVVLSASTDDDDDRGAENPEMGGAGAGAGDMILTPTMTTTTTTTTTTTKKGDNKAMSFLRKMGRVGGAANMDFATALGLDESPSGGTKSAHHEGGFKVRAVVISLPSFGTKYVCMNDGAVAGVVVYPPSSLPSALNFRCVFFFPLFFLVGGGTNAG